MDEKKLSDLIDRLVGEGPLDWKALERTGTVDRDTDADALQRLGRVARAFGTLRDAPEIPKRFGRLVLREQIGSGWQGMVFRAFDPALEREVALKLRRSTAVSGGSTRLLHEARALAKVQHTHVVEVHGADEHDGWVGIWTDLLEGETLEQRLERGGRFGVEEARLVGVALCHALAAIHGVGLTHGDIKTANVMRERDGRIVLLDFGSARPAWLTELATGTVSGSPLYMAPETLEGADSTPRSDLYALGVLLYRLVAGAYPVEAVSMTELRQRHARAQRTPLRDRRPDLPPDFVAVVEQALETDPAKRPQSAGAMERLLERRVQRRPVLLALAAAIALGGVAFGLARLAPASAIVTDAQLRRGDNGASLPSGARVTAGDELYLTLDLARPGYLQVLNEDGAGVVSRLFPVDGLEPANPLPARYGVRVPAMQGERAVNWRVGPGAGVERLLLVASPDALPLIEKRLVTWQREDAAAPRLRSIAPAEPREGASRASRLAVLKAELDASPDRTGFWLEEIVLDNPPR